MKRIAFLLLAVGMVAGCASRYNITLTNGQTITTLNKPKRHGNDYVYQTLGTIPASYVVGIQPAYKILLTDGQVIDTLNKPKRQGENYVYRLTRTLPSGSVIEIYPASDKRKANEMRYLPVPQR